MKQVTTYKRIYNITEEIIIKNGIKGLLVDMDNTLLPWDETEISEDSIKWLKGMEEMGIKVCIISNSGLERVSEVMDKTDFKYFHQALKPLPFKFIMARKYLGTKRKNTCVVGDQLVTDFFGAFFSGHKCILVEPMSDKEHKLTAVNRFIERMILGRDVRGNFDKK